MTGQEPDVTPPPTLAAVGPSPSADGTAAPGVTDRDGFAQLFAATYRPLVAYARRRTPSPADADDLVAEVYATAWRRRHEIRADLSPLPWLYAVAGNLVRNARRAEGRRLRLVDKLAAEPTPTAGSAPLGADPAERPGADLRAALAELSFDDQELLRLIAWEGLTHAEIGRVLGCTANAVAIRAHRARQRLADQLKADRSAADPSTTTITHPALEEDQR
ncbi:MAG: sigma-70 family RNA polymerase sigma factor [Acidimicrobiales bacterium]